MAPPISVTMCLHNSLPYIDETIQSLLAQSWRDFEAILVDDGSEDGTADHIARNYPDPRLKIIRQANAGMGKARSISVAHAQGEYVAFLDHDDVWLPGKLERQIAMASKHSDAALIFSDCLLIDSTGHILGTTAERYQYDRIDLRAGYAHDELLLRGCFITMSTAMVKLSELRKFGVPNPKLRYGDDYDMWLRLSRNHPVLYIDEVLAKWRLHATSITERHPEISAGAHAQIWGAIVHNHTYPPDLRTTVADHLFGQQRCAIRHLIHQRRPLLILRIAAQMLKEPDAMIRFLKDRICRTALGKALLLFVIRSIRFTWNRLLWTKDFLRDLFLRVKDFIRTLPKRVHGQSWYLPGPGISGMHVWVDGTSLNSQAGYFNFVCETVRSLARDKRGFTIHVTVPPGGRSALCVRLGDDASLLQYHTTGRKLPGPMKNETTSWGAGFAKYLARILSQLSRLPPVAEILIWRGRFRFENSLKIAVIHDVTTRLLPEFHTSENVAEFDEFVRYAQRNADLIATVSEQSRRDIIECLDVRPNSVRVVLSQIHPVYHRPKFDRRVPALHGLQKPYLLCVGTIEPRKNLRRLVDAFAELLRAGALQEHVLAIAGPQGWDDTFDQFLLESDASAHIRPLGFVPLEHMPSLYHFASSFIYPSLYEGFGLPVVEALCSSAVALTSNVASLAEIAGNVVRTFNPLDTTSIAEALLVASTMAPESAVEYRKQCRERGKQLLRESADRPSMAALLTNPFTEDRCALPSFSPSLT